MRPLPATQRVTARLIVRGGRRTIGIMSWRRTWRACRARQISLLPRRLTICIRMARWRKRLSVGAVHGWRVAHSTPDGVRRDKSLRLRRDGREDAVLVEPQAIRAAAVVGGLEAGASNLSWGQGFRVETGGSCLPCVDGSTCRQWRSSVAEPAAGGAGPCSWGAAAAGLDMDRGEEGPATIPEGPAAGRAVDVTGAGGPPCRDEVLVEEDVKRQSLGEDEVSI